MKTRILSTVILSLFVLTQVVDAQKINIKTSSGSNKEVEYNNQTFARKGVVLENNEIISYKEIVSISTSDFEAFKKAAKKSVKRAYSHLEVNFTGDENLYELQLKELERRRMNGHAVRGAGGILALVGAISGDRDLYLAGTAAYGIGTIGTDINAENTISTQNAAIFELQEQQKVKEDKEEAIESYRKEYGSENIDAIMALLENDYERSLALANVCETSRDANHRITSVWLKATIATEQGNTELAKKEYDRLMILDPTLNSETEVKEYISEIMMELEKLKQNV